MPSVIIQLLMLIILVLASIEYGSESTIPNMIVLLSSAVVLLGAQYLKPIEFNAIKKLIETSTVPMYYMNRSMNVNYANENLCVLLGFTKKEIVGQNVKDLILKSASKHVVESKRQEFIDQQLKFIVDVKERGVKNLETTVLFENSESGRNRQIWIHADVLCWFGVRMGTFVLFHEEPSR